MVSRRQAAAALPAAGGQASLITPAVLAELQHLTSIGLNVATLAVPDRHQPDVRRQSMIDKAVAALERSPTGADQFRSYPALGMWSSLVKRAIALHTLYNPHAGTVGEGIDPAVYDAPLFDGSSATSLLHQRLSPPVADDWISKYRAFLPTVIDDGDGAAVGSRDFFTGTADARAVRTRATAAMNLAVGHINRQPCLAERQDLVTASLACGAAGPVYELLNGLRCLGHGCSRVILVDQDPMALATAASLAERAGVADMVSLELHDLLTDKITDYIAPRSVDLVDLLGLFEYIPNDDRRGRLAEALLTDVGAIVRPGGLIVFGNMLKQRPQQDFFSRVVKWPRLQQRTITEVLAILTAAGYSTTDVTVRIPEEGVYAVYAVRA